MPQQDAAIWCELVKHAHLANPSTVKSTCMGCDCAGGVAVPTISDAYVCVNKCSAGGQQTCAACTPIALANALCVLLLTWPIEQDEAKQVVSQV